MNPMAPMSLEAIRPGPPGLSESHLPIRICMSAMFFTSVAYRSNPAHAPRSDRAATRAMRARRGHPAARRDAAIARPATPLTTTIATIGAM